MFSVSSQTEKNTHVFIRARLDYCNTFDASVSQFDPNLTSSLAKQGVKVIKPTSVGNPGVKVQMTGPFLLHPPLNLRTELVYNQFCSEMLFL